MGFEKIEPKIWKPTKKDEEITGILISVAPSPKFDNKIYKLECKEDGNLMPIIVFGTTVLDDRMSYVREGTEVKIVFKGVEKNMKGNDTKVFEVFKNVESKEEVTEEIDEEIDDEE